MAKVGKDPTNIGNTEIRTQHCTVRVVKQCYLGDDV